MSYIVKRKKTIGDLLLFAFANDEGEKIIKDKGDFIYIYVGENLNGINVKNHEKYFKAKNGTHSLSEEHRKYFSNLNINLSSCLETVEVLSIKVHDKSDRLIVLKVMGQTERQVVTNIKSIKEGDKIVIAKPGALLPNGLSISNSKIMGVKSEGSIVSGKTLNLENEGIYITKQKIGSEFIF